MTRPRQSGSRDLAGLPLYAAKVKGRTYYRFKDPVTRRFFSLGSDKAAAVKAARALMARRQVDKVEALIRRVDSTDVATKQICADFRDDLATRALSPKTLHDYDLMLRRFEKAMGATPFALVSLGALADFLKPLPPRQYNLMRGLLVQLWRYAIGHGLAKENVADQTLKKSTAKTRPRLTEPGYAAIRAKAEPWLQRAMDLALYDIQRAEDNAMMRVDQWSADRGLLRVKQSKTGAHLEIAAGAQLRAAVEAAVRHAVDSRLVNDGARPLTAAEFSKAFADARDRVPAFRDLPSRAKPSLHELRSLGAAMYLWKCRDVGLVQRLLGHRTPQQTLNYLEGHELPPEAVASS